MKKYIYALSVISAALIVGCGSGSSVSDQQFTYDTSSIFGYSENISYKNYVVKATDDPIINAQIQASNCEDYEELGDGDYLLKKCVGKPIYVEVKNGIIKNKNVKQNFPLLLNVSQTDLNDGYVITPLSTLLVNASENEINQFADKLGVTKDELFSDKNEKVTKLFPKINAILVSASLQSAITNKVKFIDFVRKSVLDNLKNGDLNVSGVINEVQKTAANPNLFGVIIIKNNINDKDPLESISKLQNSKSIKFYGLVFDSKIADANITLKDVDADKTYELNVSSDSNGIWSIEINEDNNPGSLYYTIMNEDHLLQLIAQKGKIKLTSTLTTNYLRNLLKNTRIISPTLNKNLIISNITTAQDAILDKEGALNINSYEGNLSTLKLYYQDKLLTAASMIKAYVDNNASMDADNTYDLVKNSVIETNNSDIDINTSNIDANISKLEENITNDTILSSQLNNIEKPYNENFQKVAENANYVFYRLLAYYNGAKTDNDFIREYTKIIVYPGYYETKKCYLTGSSTNDWKCDKPVIIKDKSNFSNDVYSVNDNNKILSYSLDFNASFYVEKLNKNYNYYGVITREDDLANGKIKTEPMILVDSYDIVDAFRRMPKEAPSDFDELKKMVAPYNTKKEVVFALNRWVKSFIGSVKNYFTEK